MIRRTAICLGLIAALAAGCSTPPAHGLTAAWRWHPPPLGSVGMPAADRTSVGFTYGHLRLVVLDGDGHRRWEAERLGLRDVAPLFLSDRVVAATDNGAAAFARSDGTRIWDVDLGDRANTPVAAGAGTLVVTTWDGRLLLLDAATGVVRTTVMLPGDVLGPAATGSGVAVASWDDGFSAGVVAVSAATGEVRWRHAVAADGVSSPAVMDGVAVVVTGDARMRAFDVSTGSGRWTRTTSGAGSPEVPPAVATDIVVADRLGTVTALHPGTGAVQWRTSGHGAAVRGGPAVVGPVVALPIDDGRVLVRHGRTVAVIDPPGRVSGVAAGPGALLLVATREAAQNELVAYRFG